jgi:hypothetical protein
MWTVERTSSSPLWLCLSITSTGNQNCTSEHLFELIKNHCATAFSQGTQLLYAHKRVDGKQSYFNPQPGGKTVVSCETDLSYREYRRDSRMSRLVVLYRTSASKEMHPKYVHSSTPY